MDDERHLQLYLDVLRRWGTPGEIEALMRWGTPAELLAILRQLGSPDQASSLLARLSERQAAWEWKRQFWRNAREALIWFGLIGGLFGAIVAARAVWNIWAILSAG